MEQTTKKAFDLQDRLIAFAVLAMGIAESLPNSKAGNHLSGQLVRSATSPALNYGEAQSAESRGDFIHKLKVILKELRETLISLKIIQRANMFGPADKLELVADECNQLIAIFVKIVQTSSGKTRNRVAAQ
jgi:four helix bundle protein